MRHTLPSAALVAVLVGALLGMVGPTVASPAGISRAEFGPTGPERAATAARAPLPVGTDWDYQLGAPRKVPDHVGIVLRDRSARPLPGRYNICYVNAFQTQPDERRLWKRHPRLILRRHGRPVVDSAWGEKLLDIRSPAKRQRLARIVGRWLEGCARDGFDAVELDNLDSFSRSHHLVKRRHAKAFARALTRRAHRLGLSVGQKNWAPFDGRRVGFDFAIAEECGQWRECKEYVAHYGRQVLVVEYRDAGFRRACRQQGVAVVRRDLALSRHGTRRWC